MAIGSTFQLILLPFLVGYLIHCLEERVNDSISEEKYRSRLISLLIVFVMGTVFSALCEWLSFSIFHNIGQKIKYSIAYDLYRAQIVRLSKFQAGEGK